MHTKCLNWFRVVQISVGERTSLKIVMEDCLNMIVVEVIEDVKHLNEYDKNYFHY